MANQKPPAYQPHDASTYPVDRHMSGVSGPPQEVQESTTHRPVNAIPDASAQTQPQFQEDKQAHSQEVDELLEKTEVRSAHSAEQRGSGTNMMVQPPDAVSASMSASAGTQQDVHQQAQPVAMETRQLEVAAPDTSGEVGASQVQQTVIKPSESVKPAEFNDNSSGPRHTEKRSVGARIRLANVRRLASGIPAPGADFVGKKVD
ncbi:hypothetical protein [Nitrospirillum amazonense]|uniref:hypothetical protein n=1 Tax=Nitrospirillum amazonense TaxID=28077 RepID=UPI002412A2E3|nr:hypothetical protein [Nitrospirillum amazonense]MDG3444553.1 hypothetical protein [Nitrospirillum amazonense]